VEGVSIEDADAALCAYLYGFKPDKNFPHDLQKVQNRAEAVLLHNNIKIDDRASNLAVGETISNVEYFLDERQHYFDVTEEQMSRLISEMLTEKESNTLYYKAIK